VSFVTIRLEVYLPFRGRSVWKGEEAVPAPATAATVLSHLGLDGHPELSVIINGRLWPEDTLLVDGDQVAVLRAAEGG
jgi:sulfur carrier protein ThiS